MFGLADRGGHLTQCLLQGHDVILDKSLDYLCEVANTTRHEHPFKSPNFNSLFLTQFAHYESKIVALG